MSATDSHKSLTPEDVGILPLLPILAGALCLRLFFLEAQTFYIDEAFNYWLGSQSFSGIIQGSAFESNPPLPVIIAHFWIKFGSGVVWLRLMSVAFSLGAVVCVYFLGARICGKNGAVLSSLLMSLSPSQLYFSHVFRYPALAIFIGAACSLMFVLILFDGRKRMILPFSALCAAGLMTHYFFFFLIIAFNFCYFLFKRDRNTISPILWLISQGAIVVIISPWLKYFSLQGVKELSLVSAPAMTAHIRTFPFKGTVNVLQAYISGLYPFGNGLLYIFIVSIWIAACAGTFFLYDIKRERINFCAVALVICIGLPYVLMFVFGLRLNPSTYFCMFSPIFFVLLSCILLSGVKSAMRYVAVCSTIVIFCFSIVSYAVNASPARDNEDAIAYISKHYRDGDIVLINPTYQASLFHYFAPGRFTLFGIPRDFDVLTYNFHDTRQVSLSRLMVLDRKLKHGGRVWAFFGFGTKTKPDQHELTVTHLDTNYDLKYEMRFAPVAYANDAGLLRLYEKFHDATGDVK